MNSSSSKLKSVETPWKSGTLSICTKCSQTMAEPGNAAENLKKFLKEKLREKGLAKDVRVLTSSCLDVCVAGEQTVCFQSATGAKPQTFTVHPDRDREAILDFLIQKSSSRS